MAKFIYDFKIEAGSEKEADAKMEALTVIVCRLSTKEMSRLADIVKNDPVKLALAKSALGV